MSEEKLSSNQYVILVFLCGLSYGILIALNAAQASVNAFVSELAEAPLAGAYIWIFQLFSIPGFQSPMFWIMPLLGFFGMALAIGWVNKNIKAGLSETLNQVILLAAFVLLALLAYYVALYWYIANFALLQGVEMTPEIVNFWGRLQGSAYMLFFWGGVFGWVMRFAVERLKI